jgi:hypothetical protein
MSSYKLILPENFTKDHIDYIKGFRRSVIALSGKSNTMFGAKDINSRHIISTDSVARIVGLKNGNEMQDRLDSQLPCPGVAENADYYQKEDLSLINTLNINKMISTLNIHHYDDGLKARIFRKYILHHHSSEFILGTIYSGHNVVLKDTLKIIPSYIARYDITSSIQSIDKDILINGVKLTNYEQEICFLIMLNWGLKQIADFMNRYQPRIKERTLNAIVRKKNNLCHKFNLSSNKITDLQDFLVSIGFHNKIPAFFFDRMIG